MGVGKSDSVETKSGKALRAGLTSKLFHESARSIKKTPEEERTSQRSIPTNITARADAHPTTSAEKIRIALVDDDEVIHVAMRHTFKNHASDWVLVGYTNGHDALHNFAQNPPRAVLMDISMPEMTGIECVKQLKASFPQLPVVMFTARDDTENLFSAMMAGASGYVVKPSSPVETVAAVKKALDGTAALCARTEQTIVDWLHNLGRNVSSWKLTSREQQIMLHVCVNRPDKEIAELLNLSYRTVHAHLRNIYQRLGVHGREEARRKFISWHRPSKNRISKTGHDYPKVFTGAFS